MRLVGYMEADLFLNGGWQFDRKSGRKWFGKFPFSLVRRLRLKIFRRHEIVSSNWTEARRITEIATVVKLLMCLISAWGSASLILDRLRIFWRYWRLKTHRGEDVKCILSQNKIRDCGSGQRFVFFSCYEHLLEKQRWYKVRHTHTGTYSLQKRKTLQTWILQMLF